MQVSLMRLFDRPMQPAELDKVHQLLMDYYSELIGNEADEIMQQKGYSQEDLDRVLNQSRRTAQ
ncbi:hypothetical protein J2I47_09270 [Fibrella sp. HMF5335]|uniref:Uncharacterized protein n=1 Tax=Fibrella rubiginis TaxID=2817060 RepID=A0A939GFA5_9BACT|nr:hypothetical protein [Fibrella rubiginis]MBO0936733.1 hypothetical protein [Fibrella rubiginis]